MNTKQSGMTLIEISVVLLILIALAGLVVPYVGGIGRSTLCKATDATMQNVRKAIMNGFYQNNAGYFPKLTRDNVANFNLTYLFEKGPFNDFDYETNTGWNGPYVTSSVKMSATNVSNLSSTFKDSSGGTPHVHSDISTGNYVILDGWGRPIIIQKHATNGFRLISAGPGSGVGVNNADIDTAITSNKGVDDRVLYLNSATPPADVNTSCDS